MEPTVRFPEFKDSWNNYKIEDMFDRVGTPVDLDDTQTYREIGIRSHGKGIFHKEETNIGNGQLIYSTHDTVNLNKDTFRRDEIWFAEKDKDGISTIYSLSDYKIKDTKVRNDATYNKDYLSGRYGAIPVLEDFNIL